MYTLPETIALQESQQFNEICIKARLSVVEALAEKNVFFQNSMMSLLEMIFDHSQKNLASDELKLVALQNLHILASKRFFTRENYKQSRLGNSLVNAMNHSNKEIDSRILTFLLTTARQINIHSAPVQAALRALKTHSTNNEIQLLALDILLQVTDSCLHLLEATEGFFIAINSDNKNIQKKANELLQNIVLGAETYIQSDEHDTKKNKSDILIGLEVFMTLVNNGYKLDTARKSAALVFKQMQSGPEYELALSITHATQSLPL